MRHHSFGFREQTSLCARERTSRFDPSSVFSAPNWVTKNSRSDSARKKAGRRSNAARRLTTFSPRTELCRRLSQHAHSRARHIPSRNSTRAPERAASAGQLATPSSNPARRQSSKRTSSSERRDPREEQRWLRRDAEPTAARNADRRPAPRCPRSRVRTIAPLVGEVPSPSARPHVCRLTHA
jgi:hypothetical protein